MSNFPYSQLCVIYTLCRCALGFGLRNAHDIYILQMAMVVLWNLVVCCYSET